MAAEHFFFRLVPPRASFPFDMDARERALMGEHAAYLESAFDAGKVLAFGPVLDAAGPFGMALLEMRDRAEAEEFAAGDPTVRAGLTTFTVSPMRLGRAQGSR